MRVLPLRVAHRTKPDDAAPSVQSHYRTFTPTTSDSAPVPRIGTLTLAEAFRLGFSLGIGTTGSHVPYRSLTQAHAAFMPDASWAVSRFLPTSIPGSSPIPVLTPSMVFRHVISSSLSFVFLSLT